MQLDLECTITIAELLHIAAWLISEDGENPEYDRALAELLCDAAGVSMDHKEEMLSEMREETWRNMP